MHEELQRDQLIHTKTLCPQYSIAVMGRLITVINTEVALVIHNAPSIGQPLTSKRSVIGHYMETVSSRILDERTLRRHLNPILSTFTRSWCLQKVNLAVSSQTTYQNGNSVSLFVLRDQ